MGQGRNGRYIYFPIKRSFLTCRNEFDQLARSYSSFVSTLSTNELNFCCVTRYEDVNMQLVISECVIS